MRRIGCRVLSFGQRIGGRRDGRPAAEAPAAPTSPPRMLAARGDGTRALVIGVTSPRWFPQKFSNGAGMDRANPAAPKTRPDLLLGCVTGNPLTSAGCGPKFSSDMSTRGRPKSVREPDVREMVLGGVGLNRICRLLGVGHSMVQRVKREIADERRDGDRADADDGGSPA